MSPATARRLAAEFTGTGLLVAVVVGSGIAATSLTSDGALRLLISSLVTQHAPWAVGAWIGAAYWLTASTSFANPAVTIGRTLTPTYAGIAPASAPAFHHRAGHRRGSRHAAGPHHPPRAQHHPRRRGNPGPAHRLTSKGCPHG